MFDVCCNTNTISWFGWEFDETPSVLYLEVEPHLCRALWTLLAWKLGAGEVQCLRKDIYLGRGCGLAVNRCLAFWSLQLWALHRRGKAWPCTCFSGPGWLFLLLSPVWWRVTGMQHCIWLLWCLRAIANVICLDLKIANILKTHFVQLHCKNILVYMI